MTDQELEVLSALIDGEPVDADAVAAALRDEGGRELLHDLLELRARVDASGEEPRLEYAVAPRSKVRRRIPLGWAAALVVATALGFAASPWLRPEPTDSTLEPPRPDRVLRFAAGVDWDKNTPAEPEEQRQ